MNLEKARTFLYRNARPLDFARWQYLFESGSRERVLQCLAAYQNPDGGFGHALEADCWNPESTPVQTWAATQILREVGLEEKQHPLVQGILRYLQSGQAFDGTIWENTVSSNDAYPHAPWWAYAPQEERSYNPTASLIGFIFRYAAPDSELYHTAQRLFRQTYAWFRAHCPLESMHTAACFVELFEDLLACGVPEVDLTEFEQLLQIQVRHVLEPDTEKWKTEYVCRPSLLIHSRSSRFYEPNRTLCEFECRFLSDTQQADGTWAVTWDWGQYPEQWSVSKNWWKADLILKNLRFWREMNG